MHDPFSYNRAFSRNIGWVTAQEQAILRHKRVAIAGMGGAGGFHLLTLARLGIGAFHIADFDTFDVVNFNRQAGAGMSTVGRKKHEVMAELVRDINPEIDIRAFPDGVTEANLQDFLADVDIYIDGLDFFALPAREKVFAACAEQGIPALTAAPLGMGAAVLAFLPGGMTFEEYFRLHGLSENEKALRFLLGLAPARLQMGYLVDPSRVDLEKRQGPSTVMACELCAGIAGVETLKILLNRGQVRGVPWGLHFDAYRNRLAHTWRPGGNNNPLQRMALSIARRQLGKRLSRATAHPSDDMSETGSVVEKILDAARWAPSGDNTQPWRFQIVSEEEILVHGEDTRDHCVYDLDGHPSQIAHGALLETLSIAASAHGLQAMAERVQGTPDSQPIYRVRLTPVPDQTPHPLEPYIRHRSVQRRAMSTRRLLPREKTALEEAAGNAHEVLWLEEPAIKRRIAWLLFKNARIRLTMEEAYRVHRSVIEWHARFSETKIPDEAIGLDPMTLRLMRWVMKSWSRVQFFNRFLAGTLTPRIELDLIPGMACAGHFILVSKAPLKTLEDYVEAGRAVQRFWLTATKLGLFIQPEMTPLIFGRYVREGTHFTASRELVDEAARLYRQLRHLLGDESADRAAFMGRIGSGAAPQSRSVRRGLSRLLRDNSAVHPPSSSEGA